MADPTAPPTWPPPTPYPLPPQPPRRSWRVTASVAVVSAAVAATIAGVLTAGYHQTATDTTMSTIPTVTVTPQSVTPSSAAPMPAAEADRTTCQAWLSTGTLIRAASDAQSVIPPGMTILDPAVQENPVWKAGVIKAGDLYAQAADTLGAGIAPGTTPVLEQTAHSAVDALRALSTATTAFDEASGNGYSLVKNVANATDVLCERFAPR